MKEKIKEGKTNQTKETNEKKNEYKKKIAM